MDARRSARQLRHFGARRACRTEPSGRSGRIGRRTGRDDTRLQKLDADVVEEMDTTCCYAKSDKYWATDPTGIAWETYHTLDSVPVFGGPQASGCCVPEPAVEKAACCTPARSAAGGCC
jgi:hypothetical protein